MSEENNTPTEPKNLIFKDEEGLLLNHDYDGIQELDHPLPSWWLGILYVSIVFSVFYAGYYMTGIGPTLREELEVAMEKIEANKAQASAQGGSADEMENIILANLQNPDKIKNGLAVYTGKCAACHGDQGQGLIGPNLTDDYWMYGKGTLTDIAILIRDGIPEKGMPPWGGILSPDELHDVTAYIRTLHGTNPPGGKEPQGERQDLVSL
jgi:cytochrome c oxidase cbb3-type subunit III